MSGMANIGRYRPVELECGLLEGQPPGSSGTKVQLTPDRGKVSRHGGCRWGVGSDPAGLRAHRLFRHLGAIPRKLMDRITGSCREPDCADLSGRDG